MPAQVSFTLDLVFLVLRNGFARLGRTGATWALILVGAVWPGVANAQPVFQASYVSKSYTVYAGETSTRPEVWSVINSGSVNSALNFGLVRTGGVSWIEPSPAVGTVTRTASTAPGESKIAIVISAPPEAVGSYSASFSLTESAQGQSYAATITVTVLPRPNLMVEPTPQIDSQDPSGKVYRVGQTVTLKCLVRNTGGGEAADSRVGYYIANSATSGRLVASDATGIIAAGEGSIESETYTFTAEDVGTKYLLCYADYLEVVAEKYENDNYYAAGPFTVEYALPVVTTATVTQTTQTGASVGGTVVNDGGTIVTERGYVFRPTPGPTTENATKATDGSGVGSFGSMLTLTPLMPGTTYYLRAYATNAVGTGYGNEVQFTTQPGLPTVTTGAVTQISATGARFDGAVVSDGGATVTERGYVYGTASMPTTGSATKYADGSGVGAFASTVTQAYALLVPGTTYYLRAYATNSFGTAYGEERIFTTSSAGTAQAISDLFDAPLDVTSTWEVLGGAWSTSGGQLSGTWSQSAAYTDQGKLLLRGQNLDDDFDATFVATLVNGAHGFSLYDSPNNLYNVNVASTGVWVEKRVNTPDGSPFIQVANASLTTSSSSPAIVRLGRRGAAFTVWVNGIQVLQFTDPHWGGRLRTGLKTYGTATFDSYEYLPLSAVMLSDTLDFSTDPVAAGWAIDPSAYGRYDFANQRLNAYQVDAGVRLYRALTVPQQARELRISYRGNTANGSWGSGTYVQLGTINGEVLQITMGWGDSSGGTEGTQMAAEFHLGSQLLARRYASRQFDSFVFDIVVRPGSIAYRATRSDGTVVFDFPVEVPGLVLSALTRFDLGLYQTVTDTIWADDVSLRLLGGDDSGTATLTVMALPAAGGTVTGGGTFAVGTSQTITATPAAGYLFAGWSDGNTSATRQVAVVAGGATYTANFSLVPPSLTTQPDSQVVVAGATATMSVVATGEGLAYQWRKNGEAMNGANAASLVVPAAQYADAASYDVVVSNSGGSVTSDAAKLYVGTGTGPYRMGTYAAADADLPALAVAQFGAGATLADWDEIKAAYGMNLTAFYQMVGMADGFEAMVMRGGARISTGSRQYYAQRSDSGLPYAGFAAHDQAGSLYLGSWFGFRMPFVVKVPVSVATLSVVALPAAGGTVTGGGTFAVGTSQTITATPAAGYLFAGWSDGNTSATRQVTVVAGGATYTANFSLAPLPTVTLTDGQSFNFTTLAKNSMPTGGEFYFYAASAKFFANNLGQPGLKSLGDQGSTRLADMVPTANGYTRQGVPIVVGHCYVSFLRASSPGQFVVFRVTELTATAVTLEYLVRATAPAFAILMQPANIGLYVGSTAELRVGGVAPGGMTFQWRKAGTALDGQTGALLSLSNVQLADAGQYDVIVSHNGTSLTSAAATLSIVDQQAPIVTIATAAVDTGGLTATVSGTATDAGRGGGGVTSVSVNGVLANGGSASGAGIANWSAAVPVAAGNNTITVVARDGSNNAATVTQSLVAPAVLRLASATHAAPAAGETYALAIESNTNWTVTSNQAWATVAPASGSGSATVTVTVAANSSGVTRSANVTVGEQVHAITQGAAVTQSPAIRTLPAFYVPGGDVTVTTTVTPSASATAYALEDGIPTGWTFKSSATGGVFDANTRRVKFGPYFDNTARTLSYVVTAPADVTGDVAFTGTVSIDGVNTAIGGQSTLAKAIQHPADLNAADWRITIGEMTAYAAAWRGGATWSIPPSPPEIAHVVRAAFLWKGGETYRLDPTVTSSPAWWVLTTATIPAPDMTEAPGSSVRSISGSRVTITVTPPTSALAYGVEDVIPAGLAVSGISDSGVFDTNNGRVKWGPFFDSNPRTLTYDVSGADGTYTLSGVVSFDGINQATSGTATLTLAATSFSSWKAARFTADELLDAGVSGGNADPDGDGLVNLVEYALDLDPKSPTFSGAPTLTSTATEWAYLYTRPADRPDVTYSVEWSANLTDWSSAGVTHSRSSVQGSLETWTASLPLSSGANVFFRLRVTIP